VLGEHRMIIVEVTKWHKLKMYKTIQHMQHIVQCERSDMPIYAYIDTILYCVAYFTCSKKLTVTDSQLSLPHGMNKKHKRKKN